MGLEKGHVVTKREQAKKPGARKGVRVQHALRPSVASIVQVARSLFFAGSARHSCTSFAVESPRQTGLD